MLEINLFWVVLTWPAVTWYMQVKAAVYHVTAGNGVNRVLGQAGFIWAEVTKMMFLAGKTTKTMTHVLVENDVKIPFLYYFLLKMMKYYLYLPIESVCFEI